LKGVDFPNRNLQGFDPEQPTRRVHADRRINKWTAREGFLPD
jgi:hypothetical protein